MRVQYECVFDDDGKSPFRSIPIGKLLAQGLSNPIRISCDDDEVMPLKSFS